MFAPRLARLWIAIPLWLAAGAGLIWVINHYVSGNEALVGTGAPQIEITKVVLTPAAGVGAVLAGVYAYRKQRLEEGSSHRADADTFADRYNSAVDQLGADAAAIRLAGAYAMARLADDWTEQRQGCVDVLCGYLRMARPTDPATVDESAQEQEVRETIQTLIAAHLREREDPRSWSGLDFNFERARLVNLDLSGARFSGDRTSFAGASFYGDDTLFLGATFSGASTSFHGATFSDNYTSFYGATFSGSETTFHGATFSGSETTFAGASFSGDRTSFHGATFASKKTTFHGATFSGDRTTFSEATFASRVTTFAGATFSGDRTTFSEATFSGEVLLPLSSSRRVTFDKSTWQGPGPFLLDSTEAPSPNGSIRVTWDKVQLLDGAQVTHGGKPFNGWPPNQPADPQATEPPP